MTAEKLKNYSVWLGIWKTIKNAAIVLLPYFVAVKALNLPDEAGVVAALIVYMLKNFAENKD